MAEGFSASKKPYETATHLYARGGYLSSSCRALLQQKTEISSRPVRETARGLDMAIFGLLKLSKS
jgi:hypothetical protein